jgi:hypothetical protein
MFWQRDNTSAAISSGPKANCLDNLARFFPDSASLADLNLGEELLSSLGSSSCPDPSIARSI